MLQLVLGPNSVARPVGKQNTCTSHSKQAVCKKHGLGIALVKVGSDGLHCENQGQGIGAHSQNILGEIHGQEASAAAHTREIEGLDVASEAESVDDHGCERGGGGGEAAVGDNEVDAPWIEVVVGEKVVDDLEKHGLDFFHGGGERVVEGEEVHAVGEA